MPLGSSVVLAEYLEIFGSVSIKKHRFGEACRVRPRKSEGRGRQNMHYVLKVKLGTSVMVRPVEQTSTGLAEIIQHIAGAMDLPFRPSTSIPGRTHSLEIVSMVRLDSILVAGNTYLAVGYSWLTDPEGLYRPLDSILNTHAAIAPRCIRVRYDGTIMRNDPQISDALIFPETISFTPIAFERIAELQRLGRVRVPDLVIIIPKVVARSRIVLRVPVPRFLGIVAVILDVILHSIPIGVDTPVMVFVALGIAFAVVEELDALHMGYECQRDVVVEKICSMLLGRVSIAAINGGAKAVFAPFVVDSFGVLGFVCDDQFHIVLVGDLSGAIWVFAPIPDTHTIVVIIGLEIIRIVAERLCILGRGISVCEGVGVGAVASLVSLSIIRSISFHS